MKSKNIKYIFRSAAVLVFAALLMLTPETAWAAHGDPTNIADDPTAAEAWYIDSDHVLHITGVLPSITSAATAPWYAYKTSIYEVKVYSGAKAGEKFIRAFNDYYSLTKVTGLGLMDFSLTTDMSVLFSGDTALTEVDMKGLKAPLCTNLEYLFNACSNLTKVDLSNSEFPLVTNVTYIFNSTGKLTDVDYTNAKFPKVTSSAVFAPNLTSIKASGADFTGFTTGSSMGLASRTALKSVDFSGADLSNITTMASFLSGDTALESADFSNTKLTKTTSFLTFFQNCSKLTDFNFTGADQSALTNAQDMFKNCDSIEAFSMAASGIETSKLTSIQGFLCDCDKVTSIDFSGCDFGKVTNVRGVGASIPVKFSLNLSNTDFSSLTSISNPSAANAYCLFSDATNLETVDLSGAKFSALTSMQEAFKGLTSLKSVKFDGADLSALTTMQNIFNGCTSLTQATFIGAEFGKLTNINGLLYGCASMEEYSIHEAGIDTSKVTDASYLFFNCSKLTKADLSNCDFSALTTVSQMFRNVCGSTVGALKCAVDFSGSTFGVLTNLKTADNGDNAGMFYGANNVVSVDFSNTVFTKLPNLNNVFYTLKSLESVDFTGAQFPALTSMQHTFRDCLSFKTVDFTGASLPLLTSVYAMFMNCDAMESFSWKASGIPSENLTDIGYVLADCDNLTAIDFSDSDFSKLPNSGVYNPFRDVCGTSVGTKKFTLDLSGSKFPLITSFGYSDSNNSFLYKTQNMEKIDMSEMDLSAMSNMMNMFRGSKSIKTVLFTDSNISNVTSMYSMFYESGPLETLDFSGTTTPLLTSMNYMFYNNDNMTEFTLKDTHLDTSHVTSMNYIFSACDNLQKIDLSDTNFSSLTTFPCIFSNVCGTSAASTKKFTVDWSNSDLSSITSFGSAASDTSAFYQAFNMESIDFSGTDLSKLNNLTRTFYNLDSLKTVKFDSAKLPVLTSLQYAFAECDKLEGVSFKDAVQNGTLTNMSYTFYNCDKLTSFSLKDTGIDVTGVTTMDQIFRNCDGLRTIDLSECDFANLTSTIQMFSNVCGSASTSPNKFTVSFRNSKFPKKTDFGRANQESGTFYGAFNMESVDFSGADISNVTTYIDLFIDLDSLKNLDFTSAKQDSVTSFQGMLHSCDGIESFSLSEVGLNTDKVTNIQGMFKNCTNLTEIDLSGADFSKVTNAKQLFMYVCGSTVGTKKFTVDMSNTKFTGLTTFGNNTAETGTFYKANNMKSLDLSGADLSTHTTFANILQDCTSLESADFSDADTSSVTNMQQMFQSCTSLTDFDFENCDLDDVTNFKYMFYGDTSLETVSLADLAGAKPTNVACMFYGCTGLKLLDLTGLDTTMVPTTADNFTGFFTNIGNSTATGTTIIMPPTFVFPNPTGSDYLGLTKAHMAYAVEEEGSPNLLKKGFMCNTKGQDGILGNTASQGLMGYQNTKAAEGVTTTYVPAFRVVFTANSDIYASDSKLTDDTNYKNGAYYEPGQIAMYKYVRLGETLTDIPSEPLTAVSNPSVFIDYADNATSQVPTTKIGSLTYSYTSLPSKDNAQAFYAIYADREPYIFTNAIKVKVKVVNSSYTASVGPGTFIVRTQGYNSATNATLASAPYDVTLETVGSPIGAPEEVYEDFGSLRYVETGVYDYTVRMTPSTGFWTDTTLYHLQVSIAEDAEENLYVDSITIDGEELAKDPESGLYTGLFSFKNKFMLPDYDTTDALFVNTYSTTAEKFYVRVDKIVDPHSESAGPFTFVLTARDSYFDEESTDYTYIDLHTIQFTLKDQEYLTIPNILKNDQITVTESGYDGYQPTYKTEGEVYTSGDTCTIAVIESDNNIVFKNDRANNILTVKKVLHNEESGSFDMRVHVTKPDGNPWISTDEGITAEEDHMLFTINVGSTGTAERAIGNVPLHSKITVEELTTTGYTTTMSDGTTTVEQSSFEIEEFLDNTTVTADNTLKDVNYTVKYYYDGVYDSELDETESGPYKSLVSTYTDKSTAKPDYEFSHDGTGPDITSMGDMPLELSLDETQNIINVFYKKKIADLVIGKTVAGAPEDPTEDPLKDISFPFEVTVTDKNGDPYDVSEYSYNISGNGAFTEYKETAGVKNILCFTLKHGASIDIKLLVDSGINIKETGHNGFIASVQAGEETLIRDTYTIEALSADGAEVQYINTPGSELPETGGPGRAGYLLAGLLLMAGAAFVLIRRQA